MKKPFALVTCLLAACAAELETGDVSQSVSGAIDHAIDVADGPCPASLGGGTCHFFELYTTTPGGFVVKSQAFELDVVAYCDGKAYAAAGASLAISYAAAQQINVALKPGSDGWPSNRACYFQLQESRITPRVVDGYTYFDPVYSNRFGPVAKIMTLSATNNGVSGSWQRFTLNGSYPGFTHSGAYTPIVFCDGSLVLTATIEAFSTTQVTLRFLTSGAWRDCRIHVRRDSDNVLSTSYHVRIGGPPKQLPAGFLGYVWSGHTSPQPVPQLTHGVSSVLSAGMRSARLRFGPAMRLAEKAAIGDGFYENIGLDAREVLAACPAEVPFLPCVVTMPAFQAALSTLPTGSPGNPVYVPMTVYDSAATGPFFHDVGRLFDDTFIEQHTDEIVEEYRALTFALYQSQVGTGRTFVIANWESDSQMGGGKLLTRPFKRWLYLRQQGVALGRADATAAGLTEASAQPALNPARVAAGIEFAFIREGQDFVLDEIITGSIPGGDPWGALCPQYALWSAWQGANAGTLDEDIPALRARLQTACPGTTLVIGELGTGYPLDSDVPMSPRDLWHLQETARAAHRWQLPFTVLWEGFSTDVPGLLYPDGADRPEMRALRNDLIAYATPGIGVLPPQAVQIHAIRDRGTTAGQPTQRNFELYGSFPGPGPYSAHYRCDPEGWQLDADVTMQPTNGQMNIWIANPAPTPSPQNKARFCSFWVVTGSTRSPEVGPRGICPVSGPMDPAPLAPCP